MKKILFSLLILILCMSCDKNKFEKTFYIIKVEAKDGVTLLPNEKIYCIPDNTIAPMELESYAKYTVLTDAQGIATFEIQGEDILVYEGDAMNSEDNDYVAYFALTDGKYIYYTRFRDSNNGGAGKVYYNLEINKSHKITPTQE